MQRSRRTQKNVGVIGLGIIGRRVADCVRRAGFSTFVWNRTPRPFPNFVGSPAEIAELCDFIQIFVSDDEALLEVVQKMKQSLGAHHIILAHSTVAPATTRAAAEIVQRRGAQLLDAPFTGSKLAAEKGELVYYIGGDEAAYRRARPVLEASSKEIIEIGEIGQATTIKIATNMITAATVQVAAEALALVHNAGLPLEKFAEAMAGNGSNSGTLKMKLPKMLQGDFEPHFSVKHMLKDVEIASRMGRAYGLALPATEAARDSLSAEARHGRINDDYSSMVRVFFPDGPPGKEKERKAKEEEQSVLTGLEELPPVAVRAPEPERIEPERVAVERTEESIARNGDLASEVQKEETPREEVFTEKREESMPEKPVEPTAEIKEETPVEVKPEEPIKQQLEEAIAEKREELAEENREESIPEKIDEPKSEEPALEEKIEEPIVAKREEPENGKTFIEEKLPEPIVEKREQANEEVVVESEVKPFESEKPEPVVITESAKVEKEDEIPEPRRSFLSRLFGKAGDY